MPQDDPPLLASGCIFCDVATAPNVNHTYGIVSREVLTSLVVAETSSFFVLLDIAPLIKNHCLVVTKEHLPAFAYLPFEKWDEFEALLKKLTEDLANFYGFRPSLFEHGVAWQNTLPSCCINHAHIHIVPTNLDITARIELDGFVLMSSGNYKANSHIIKGNHYLYYEASSQIGKFYDASKLPSQYLRQILAEFLEVGIWNWHDYISLKNPNYIAEYLAQSYQTITTIFKPTAQGFKRGIR